MTDLTTLKDTKTCGLFNFRSSGHDLNANDMWSFEYYNNVLYSAEDIVHLFENCGLYEDAVALRSSFSKLNNECVSYITKFIEFDNDECIIRELKKHHFSIYGKGYMITPSLSDEDYEKMLNAWNKFEPDIKNITVSAIAFKTLLKTSLTCSEHIGVIHALLQFFKDCLESKPTDPFPLFKLYGNLLKKCLDKLASHYYNLPNLNIYSIGKYLNETDFQVRVGTILY